MALVKAIVLPEPGSALKLEERPRPKPGPSEVLIRVEASPVNPSDTLYCRGLYGIQPTPKIIPGFEGCGEVVEAGSGWMARRLVGKRVAAATQGSDGFWAEFVVAPALTCLPLPKELARDSAASALVNPLTAWALFSPVREGSEAGLVQTAAGSQLGRMIARLGRRFKKPVIHVVHRPGLVETVRAEGGEHILDSSEPDFEKKLTDLAKRLDIRYAVDAVAGDTPRRVLSCLPKNARVLVYGSLSEKPVESDPLDLIFGGKRVEGFWLSRYLGELPLLQRLKLFRQLPGLLAGDLSSHADRALSLEDAVRELSRQIVDGTQGSSRGKVLVVP